MSIFATAGAKLYIGGQRNQKSVDFVVADFASEVWVEIADTEGLGSVGDSSESVNFTGINDARTRKLKGPRDAGTMELVCGMNSLDPGQIALVAAEASASDYAFKLVLPDVPAVTVKTATITIATPGVITAVAHGLKAGSALKFSTTGTLPTGITAGTTYYVLAAGLSDDTFQISATPGGSAINTSSTQSGTHTITSIPSPSSRYFIAKVMSQSEQFDQANSVMKLNASLGVNSNVVRVNPLP